MDRQVKDEVTSLLSQIGGSMSVAEQVLQHRSTLARKHANATDTLRKRAIPVSIDSATPFHLVPLMPRDHDLIGDVAAYRSLPMLSHDDQRLLESIRHSVLPARDHAKALLRPRLLTRRTSRERGEVALDFLTQWRNWATDNSADERLARLRDGDANAGPPNARVETLLDPTVGLRDDLSDLGAAPTLIPASVLRTLRRAVRNVGKTLAAEASHRDSATRVGNEIRARVTQDLLAEMDIDALRQATGGRLRLNALRTAGVTTVQHVLDSGDGLLTIDGVGDRTVRQVSGAALSIGQATFEETPVRINVKDRDDRLTTDLLRHLGAWHAIRRLQKAPADLAHAEAFGTAAKHIKRKATHALMLTSNEHKAVDITDIADRLANQATAAGSTDPWEEFLTNPAEYYALLAELGIPTEDGARSHGDLPDEIVEAVRAQELDTHHLRTPLRGYQAFAARFALVQRKVLIGDEMGLGKTVEALAVLTHLRTRGSQRFLVVCPAAVVTNWMREISSKTDLSAHRLHGAHRGNALRSWLRRGGVGVTTFETLRWLKEHDALHPTIDCVVVDEAHYVKNPGAQRSQRIASLINQTDRAILLTGTPLENRVHEFGHLIGYLQPKLTVDANDLTPRRFRRQVAPAYLRRNQEDVLDELPELVEVDEWLPVTGSEATSYQEAVLDGNFMAMRQAAMLAVDSAKVQRLVELVLEAEENERRVIVFSHFRKVLDRVAAELPGPVHGPLTGSVPAAKRQAIVDEFSAAPHGAALVAQIVAGGVGLNIQAASMVVICEPQTKPTTEDQAIARAHRMGQVHTVQVHRLLSEEGVDLRVTEILAEKRRLFDEFARVSETADSAPEAVDVSESALARQVIAEERERVLRKSAE